MIEEINSEDQQKLIIHSHWKTYFSKATERNFFFVLTLIMLLLGIVVKIGSLY